VTSFDIGKQQLQRLHQNILQLQIILSFHISFDSVSFMYVRIRFVKS